MTENYNSVKTMESHITAYKNIMASQNFKKCLNLTRGDGSN